MSCQWRRPPLCMLNIGMHIGASVCGQRQVRRPPDKHSSGSDTLNEGRNFKGVLGFNKDFLYINVKATCIKCGEGSMDAWLLG